MSTVDDIKAKIDLADYLREQGIQLKPAGSSLKACCPFHHEKTPSFMVSREKQVFYCFGCQAGGTVFDFIMKREGLEFGEALRLLAERAGVTLEARDPRLEGKKTRGLAVLELAAKWFRHQLEKTPNGEVARAYVQQRGIAPEIAERFQVGYAPDAWDTLSTFLVQRGFTAQEIGEAGLAITGQRAGSIYDRFRHRLMFPIHDHQGRVVGFTGRILEGGKTVGQGGEPPAKYVNTPETALYKKGAVIYALPFAKDAIRTRGYAVLVEGQMDVIASHGSGIPETVAVSGTALTESQLRLLKRYVNRLHLAFDADPAGVGAAERSIDAALDAGFDVRVIRMPIGPDGHPIAKDADECLRKNAEAWRRAAADSVPVLDFFVDRIRAKFDLREPAGQRDAGRVLVQHLVHVVDSIERAAWVRRCAEAIGVPEHAFEESLRRVRPSVTTGATGTSEPPAQDPNPFASVAERLLAIVVRTPAFGAEVDTADFALFGEHPRTPLYRAIATRYTGNGPVESSKPAGELSTLEQELRFLSDREFGDWEERAIRAEFDRLRRVLRRARIDRELREVAAQLRVVERHGGDRSDLSSLERRFDTLTRELAVLQ